MIGSKYSYQQYDYILTNSPRKHVMSDLRPYVCTFPDCPQDAKTYASRESIDFHETLSHCLPSYLEDVTSQSSAGPNIECLFCGESDVYFDSSRNDCSRARTRHISRHMEEIAFAVVPKPYEEWEFYSDSSSESLMSSCSSILDVLPNRFQHSIY